MVKLLGPIEPALRDRVTKLGGDYTFRGVVVAVFYKRSGILRYVVENDEGILHIYSRTNLRVVRRRRYKKR